MSVTSKVVPVERNGQAINLMIRPIEQSDQGLEAEFVNNLSQETKHFRFLGGVGSLTALEIEQLCDVDEHDSMAFVATVSENGITRQVGVSRYSLDQSGDGYEMALTIADDFSNTDLSTVLLDTLVSHAKKEGITELYSIELNDNQVMRALANRYHMESEPIPGVLYEVKYVLDVKQ